MVSGLKRVLLNEEDTLSARKLAQAASQREGRRQGFYGNEDGRGWNSPGQHLVGKLGEIATLRYLSVPTLVVYPHFEKEIDYGSCDITVNFRNTPIHIEVKTWRATDWDKLGRCIRPEQFCKIMTRLDLVVWCTVDNRGIDLASSAKIPVILMGFSMTHDLAKMKLTETAKGMLNYQLDATPIRGMNELAETLISFVLYKKRRAIRLGC